MMQKMNETMLQMKTEQSSRFEKIDDSLKQMKSEIFEIETNTTNLAEFDELKEEMESVKCIG